MKHGCFLWYYYKDAIMHMLGRLTIKSILQITEQISVSTFVCVCVCLCVLLLNLHTPLGIKYEFLFSRF